MSREVAASVRGRRARVVAHGLSTLALGAAVGSADAAALQLQRISSEDASAAPIPVAIDSSVPAANPRALLLTPRSPLMAGQYRLVLTGRPGAALSARAEEVTWLEEGADGRWAERRRFRLAGS